jgi:hypothetical protein
MVNPSLPMNRNYVKVAEYVEIVLNSLPRNIYIRVDDPQADEVENCGNQERVDDLTVLLTGG